MRAEEFRSRATCDPDESGSTAERSQARIAASIGAFTRREWNALFVGELEGWDYLHALELAHLNSCEPLYFSIRDHDRCLAAVPACIGMRTVGAPFTAERIQGPLMLL